MELRRLNPLEHAFEPSVAAAVFAIAGFAAVRPLLLVSGAIGLILGARLFYDHRGLGRRWNEWHERLTPVGLSEASADAHIALSGILLGVVGTLLVWSGALGAVVAFR